MLIIGLQHHTFESMSFAYIINYTMLQ